MPPWLTFNELSRIDSHQHNTINPLTLSIRGRFKMADVDMTDAPVASSGAKGKGVARVGKSGTPSDPATEGKKRFEVKKV